MSQTIVVPEYRVGRKPKTTGYESACSLPYAGSLAMSALKHIKITPANAPHKRFLVVGGCTPVGCVLIQILKHWKGIVTVTCSKRAVPVVKALGTDDAIICPTPVKTNRESVISIEMPQEAVNAFQKELELSDRFDYIIITKSNSLGTKFFEDLCPGKVISTVPITLRSDSSGLIGGFILRGLIYLKYICGNIFGFPFGDFDEGHLSYTVLDELTDLVESRCLQTVVDKVFQPKDIEIALNHIQSYDSIGSTIITFQ